MKKNIKIWLAAGILGGFAACNSLDIAPINVVQDDVALGTAAGVKAYMASLYRDLPIEDFKYSTVEGTNGFNTWNSINSLSVNTGENANRNNPGFSNPARGYWGGAYTLIRNTNYLMENLPKQGALDANAIRRWTGEAYFLRAYTYFALVKRYGGVPILKKVQNDYLNVDVNSLLVPRGSEQECYEFIGADLDSAIAKLDEVSENPGRANKYVAAAFKSRVMLFAGSIARYGVAYTVDGVMLNGIPAAKANDYFRQAFEAAKLTEGRYSLYNKKWSAVDKIATADNYADLFLDEASTENIFVKKYQFPDAAYHSWDALASPMHLTSTYGDRFNPTLDYVEMFDGLPKNAVGQINTLNADGTYKVYNSVEELFLNCEPRLRGTALLPGTPFKGGFVDIRRGTLAESVDPGTPIPKFLPADSRASYATVPFYAANVKQAADNRPASQTPLVTSTGQKIFIVGLDGIQSGSGSGNITGFCGRKYLLPNLAPGKTNLHQSSQGWIEMRYAEVLLNRAEAALELAQNGGTVPGVADLQADAYTQINAVRLRAGATLLASPAELSNAAALTLAQGGYTIAPTRGLQLVRIERRKELAFENKTYWDLKRWRTFDLEVNARIFRRLNPFLFAKGAVQVAPDYVQGKYIFDARLDERNSSFTFGVNLYYEPIPGGEISKGLKPNLSN